MPWFKKTKKPKPVRESGDRSSVPEGLWVKCDGCREVIYSKELERSLRICPKCGYHFRIDALERIRLLLDDEEPEALFARISPTDPLTYAAVGLLLAVAAAGACWMPARATLKLEPSSVLREE